MKLNRENLGIAGSTLLGSITTAAGVVAACTSSTAAISAAGATTLGVAGGIIGSSIGIATGGAGIAATIPLAAGGAAIGSWAGPALALFGIGTAPAWAIPVAVGGGMITTASLAIGAYKYFNRTDGARDEVA